MNTKHIQIGESTASELVLSMEWETTQAISSCRPLRMVCVRSTIQLDGSEYPRLWSRSPLDQHDCNRV